MSDGTINLPKRSTAPGAPAANRYKIYVDSNDDEVKYVDDLDVVRTFKGDDGAVGATGPQGIQGIQGIQGPVGPMNLEFIVNELSDVTLPNTTTFTSIYVHPFTVSSVGDCYLDIGLSLKPHNASNDIRFEFYIDGNFIEIPYTEEHKDTSTAQENWRGYPGIMLGSLAAGSHNIEMFFRKESTGGTATLKSYALKVVRYT